MSSVPRRSAHTSLLGGALLLAAAVGLLFSSTPAHAQFLPGSSRATPDSLIERLGLPEDHSPHGALRRSLMVPGWGQYYNRQYWKIPIAAGGTLAAIAALAYSWDRYFLYRNAYRYRRIGGTFVPPEEEYTGDFDGSKYERAYNRVRTDLARPPDADLGPVVRDARETFRRRGEFAILGTALFWIFQVSDAYVSAHLLGFEIDENLSLRLAPRREGLALDLRLSL